MICGDSFISALKDAGINFFCGVPCSFLAPLINEAMKDEHFIAAHNEGDAVAVCAGTYLCGRTPMLLCQNSGLSNALSPLISLNQPFSMPLVGLIGFRGEPGTNDEIQHQLMGSIHHDLLQSIGITSEILSDSEEHAVRQIQYAIARFKDRKSTFFAVQKNTFAPGRATIITKKNAAKPKNFLSVKAKNDQLPERLHALSVLKTLNGQSDAFIATTGLTSRELFSLGDRQANFYMVGSMGCVSSLALGISLFAKDKTITILDGDGALLMRLSAMAMVGRYGQTNLFHLLLDNECHASTGGQPSGSASVDFIALAHAVGYHQSTYLHSLEELQAVYKNWHKDRKLTFAYLKVNTKITPHKRPSLPPHEISKRFSQFLQSD